jgi:proteic killer suppression protein
MIESFSHKGLQELFVNGKTKRLPPERLKKIKGILTMIDAAIKIEDLRIPALRLHQLKGPPYIGYWSVDVTGNFRIVFVFTNGTASKVDYLDTH